MKRHFAFFTLALAVVGAMAEDYIESFNVIADGYTDDIQDVQVIRQINGGTVIIPIFDESCPEELKAPFSYACKIVEEYVPPCLPLKVKVSCGNLGQSSVAISKVRARSKENFGHNVNFHNAQMSAIKGIILSELCHESSVTYLDYVPDTDFLTLNPDIEITYNEKKLDEISYSLAPDPGQKYDFVSLVVRDLLIGLGISSSYRYDPITNELLNPSHEMTAFESYIDRMLGINNSPSARLNMATKGELTLREYSDQSLRLYAPSPWQNGVSLNYFIPQEDCCVSSILSYSFCKGMVTRSLSDSYSGFIFRDLLGWTANYTTSEGGVESSRGGSTSLLMPYNGSISFSNNTYGISSIIDENPQKESLGLQKSGMNEELLKYVKSFHPFQYSGDHEPSEGTSVSVLKKDGSWDLVKYIGVCVNNVSFTMSDLSLNCDESLYERTIDGYLRARITTKERGSYGKIKYKSTFFVIDYLPQKVCLSYTFPNSTTSRSSSSSSSNVRIYFSNTEGLTRLVLEKLRQGNRLPSKIEITDIKKGFFDTIIDRATTFTAVGYNDNGISQSVPITVSPLSTELALDFILDDDRIYLVPEGEGEKEYNCTITPIDRESFQSRQIHYSADGIDISTLPDGLFVLTIVDSKSGVTKSFKFKR